MTWVAAAVVEAFFIAFFIFYMVYPENKGILLPGWHCRRCKAFTGTAKENLKECRCCGEPR